jgi:Tol biopolymer transport system component
VRKSSVLIAVVVGILMASGFAAGGAPRQSACTTDPQSGAEVCQVTSDGENTISYYDTPIYSAPYKKIVYLNRKQGQPPQIMLANPDGSDARVVAYGMDPMVSPDGEKIYYVTRSAEGAPGMDLYAYDIDKRKEHRITHVRAKRLIQFSPAARTSKGNLLVYSPDNVAYLIYDDGTGNTPLQFGDPYQSDTFHRLRISPTKPNLILFNRNHRGGGGLHPLFVYDVDTKKTYKVTDQATHMLWAPDGIHIAYNGGPDYHFHITRFDGTDDKSLDPKVREGTAYCAFAPEGDVLACANWDSTGEKYPMPGSIFLLAADGSNRVAYVARHNARQEGFWGEPALNYMGDRYDIIFRSDATGEPQVYVVHLPRDIYASMKPPAPARSGGQARRGPTH